MVQSHRPATALAREAPSPTACSSDEELLAFARGKVAAARVQDMHAHLDGCETCQRVLAEAAHALATAVTTPLAPSVSEEFNTTFQRGTLVGRRYVIQRFITRGGMGEVYEAFDRELSQRVALKTVTSTASDNSSAVRRLKAEVQLARRVSHPNVCRIYDLGTHELPEGRGAIHFLTMAFVEGETLGQRVRLAGALPPGEARTVAQDLLFGLRAAHAAEVLHRDFKSDNVMLQYGPDGRTNAVVLDFGLARAVGNDDANVASNSNIVGTFGYIAPEQLEGKRHSRASDIYAFGVVWFELLTGQMPFETETSEIPVSERRIPKCAPLVPPAPSQLNPEVPAKLDALVLRCLARAPERRFQSVDELLRALDALDAPQRRPRWVLAAVAAGGAIALGAALWALQPHHDDTATPSPITTPALAIAPQLEPRDTRAVAQQPLVTAAATTREVVAIAAATSDPALNAQRPPPAKPSHPAPRPANQRASRPAAVTATTTSSAKSVTAPAIAVPATPIAAPASASTPSAAPALAPSAPKARPAKPDWENPFGAVQPTQMAAGSGVTPT
jgi:serine/threonine protein kinase